MVASATAITTVRMSSSPAVIAEFTARQQAERAKALKKYGPDALLPAGRPDLDILDYAINELVGFIRYAQMIQARHEMMLDLMEDLPKKTRELLRDGISFARELEAFAARYGIDAVSLHQRLRKQGLHLGLPEKAL